MELSLPDCFLPVHPWVTWACFAHDVLESKNLSAGSTAAELQEGRQYHHLSACDGSLLTRSQNSVGQLS